MRVLIVNTSERSGGAAVAAGRLCDALNNNGVKAKMLVRDKQTDSITVCAVGKPLLQKWRFMWERLGILLRLRLKRQHLFDIDTGGSGADITTMREFREADVIHLHWINQGMLSLSGIRRILLSGKPVVWTMHDAWPSVAICHLTMNCRRFTTQCRNCMYLPGGGSSRDLAARVWRRKQRLLSQGNITFVACSRWLEGESKASALLRGHTVTNIPNCIDTRLFCPGDMAKARQEEGLPQDAQLLLFVCQRVSNPNKGMDCLIEACRKLATIHPELTATLKLVVLGTRDEDVHTQMPFETISMGYVTDEERMARIYRASNLFVLPSLSENLPNTIMEAMACGVPCLAFRVGGIPEEIDHKRNGYLAAYRNTDDLAEGIRWILCDADRSKLSDDAVRKVAHNYSQTSVALRYSELYQQAIAQKHLKL